MHMNVSAVVVSVRVGADKGLVAGKMLFTVGKPQRLRPINGQTVVGCVPWVKADDIVVALYIVPLVVLAVPQICPDTGQGEILTPRSSACPAGNPAGG